MNDKDLEKMLAQQLMDILDKCGSTLRWKGSTVQLVELVKYVYENNELTDESGMVVCRAALARKILHRLHVKIPANLSVYFARCTGTCGVKSMSMINIMKYRRSRNMQLNLVREFVG